MIPLDDGWKAFADRFGLTVWTLHNMSELNVPIVSDPNPEVLGTCGRKRAGIELRIVDENDHELPQRQVGELMIPTAACRRELYSNVTTPLVSTMTLRSGTRQRNSALFGPSRHTSVRIVSPG